MIDNRRIGILLELKSARLLQHLITIRKLYKNIDDYLLIYDTGHTTRKISIGKTMIRLIVFVALFILQPVISSAQTLEWAKIAGSYYNSDDSQKLYIDQSGNLYKYGNDHSASGFVTKYSPLGDSLDTFRAPLYAITDIGLSPLSEFIVGGIATQGDTTPILIKYNSDKEIIWTYMPTSDPFRPREMVFSITINSESDVIIGGMAADSAFIAKHDGSTGERIWIKRFAPEGDYYLLNERWIGKSLTVDEQDNIFALCGGLMYSFQSLIVKLTNEGNILHTTLVDAVASVHTDLEYSQGFLYTSVNFSKELYYGASDTIIGYDRVNSSSVIIKADTTGQFLNYVLIGNNGGTYEDLCQIQNLEIGENGQIYALGDYINTLLFDNFPISSNQLVMETFILRLENTLEFAGLFTSVVSSESHGLATKDNKVYFSGRFSQNDIVEFGGQNIIAGNGDLYLASINTNEGFATGVVDQPVNTSFHGIYPNPVTSYFTLAQDTPFEFISITDALGKRIVNCTESEYSSHGNKVYIENIPSGLYIVTVSGFNTLNTFMLIK